jgi:hypothetical protein
MLNENTNDPGEVSSSIPITSVPPTEDSEPKPARVFHVDLLHIEKRLEACFLGADLLQACTVAAETGAAILISTAGQPLKDRENSLRIWRSSKVLAMLSSSVAGYHLEVERSQVEFAIAFMGTADKAFLDKATSGEMRLEDLNLLIAEKYWMKRKADLGASKEARAAARAAVRSLISDIEPKHDDRVEPSFMLVLSDGTNPTFWRYRMKCKEFAEASSAVSYTILPFNNVETRYRYKEEKGNDGSDEKEEG